MLVGDLNSSLQVATIISRSRSINHNHKCQTTLGLVGGREPEPKERHGTASFLGSSLCCRPTSDHLNCHLLPSVYSWDQERTINTTRNWRNGQSVKRAQAKLTTIGVFNQLLYLHPALTFHPPDLGTDKEGFVGVPKGLHFCSRNGTVFNIRDFG